MRAALFALALLAAAPASARHHHAHHHRHLRPIGAPAAPGFWSSLTGSSLVTAARAVYGRSNLWCARFMNYVLKETGHKGTGSDMARSFLAAGPRTGMHVGAIAVMSRRGGGHVGVVSGVDASGNPVIISGNNGGRVREAVYPLGRVVAFVEAR